ncbi:hypothetical protein ACFOOM_12445 [Streptomyces echinoruber]|uniref:Uncharacterized protein n=1 Tax=Streptomyces echinoruber TaxID=68898 RepID=A0A918RJ76_9ACTN|nr:hypothetical protein [Streptomyces echinoruber]GHA01036.1 hypothetical protein GCM10010389_45450 [Streptomyces echinoruber]
MIAYVFLSVGVVGAGAAVYFAAPAGRGAHRLVQPRSALRKDIARLEAEADRLACQLMSALAGRQEALRERDDALKALAEASRQIADLQKQLGAFDQLCAENTELRAELANATAMRQLRRDSSPAGDASALPDAAQEFTDTTATAWRASA